MCMGFVERGKENEPASDTDNTKNSRSQLKEYAFVAIVLLLSVGLGEKRERVFSGGEVIMIPG